MIQSATLLRTLSVGLVLALSSCAPPPEPPPEEAPPPPPPPAPPPTLYEITEVDITIEEPEFTSRNVQVFGFKLGDVTVETAEDLLGAISGDTQVIGDQYLTDYRGGAIRVHTFPQTGVAQGIEISTRFASDVASPVLSTWLEDGNVEAIREVMGPEEETDEIGSAVEYVYDSRGIRFIQYPDSGVNGIRFSDFID